MNQIDGEIWCIIDGHEEYMVSNLGRVKNHGIMVRKTSTGRIRKFDAKVLKPFYAKSTGYLRVMLEDRKKHSVHRLVAKAFCDGYSDDLVVNHKNGIRDDNRSENLEWITIGANISHAYTDLGKIGVCTGVFGFEHPASISYVAKNIKTEEEIFFPSGSDAAKAGFHSSGISHCVSGRVKTHKGHTWRYATEEEIREKMQ